MIKIKNIAPDTQEIFIYGEIEEKYNPWGDYYMPEQEDEEESVSFINCASDMVQEIAVMNPDVKNIIVHICSPGGDVFEAFAMYNALLKCGKNVTTIIDSLSASAAAIVFLAGSTRIADTASMGMLHCSSTFAMGNKDALREQADLLEKVDGVILSILKERTTMSDEDIEMVNKKDVWLNAVDMYAMGISTVAPKGGKLPVKAYFKGKDPKQIFDLLKEKNFKIENNHKVKKMSLLEKIANLFQSKTETEVENNADALKDAIAKAEADKKSALEELERLKVEALEKDRIINEAKGILTSDEFKLFEEWKIKASANSVADAQADENAFQGEEKHRLAKFHTAHNEILKTI